MKPKYLHLDNLRYLFGHVNGVDESDLKCLDELLTNLDTAKDSPFKGELTKIIAFNKQSKSVTQLPTTKLSGHTYEFRIGANRFGKKLASGSIIETLEARAPMFAFELGSSLLGRYSIAVPMRHLLKNATKLRGKHLVYSHQFGDAEQSYLYYGITKQGMNTRFMQHIRSSKEPLTLFHTKLNEFMQAAWLGGNDTYLLSTINAAGLTEDEAMDTEEYLVDKYSLHSKHSVGVNMIPGGKAGIAALHTLRVFGDRAVSTSETVDKEAVLCRHFDSHKLALSAIRKWEDGGYAESVICNNPNNLDKSDVLSIRLMSAMGHSIDHILHQSNARNAEQITRLLSGKTYGRIQ